MRTTILYAQFDWQANQFGLLREEGRNQSADSQKRQTGVACNLSPNAPSHRKHRSSKGEARYEGG